MPQQAQAYSANYDTGMAVYDTSGELHLIRWLTYVTALEYYPPGLQGRLALFGSYAHSESPNAKLYVPAAKVRDHEDPRDVCPDTGLARLSYGQARALLDEHTAVRGPGTGWDLHEYRHSALTHLGEQGASPADADGEVPAQEAGERPPLLQAVPGGDRRAHQPARPRRRAPLTLLCMKSACGCTPARSSATLE